MSSKKILYILLLMFLSLFLNCHEDNNHYINADPLNRIKSLEKELLDAATKEKERDILFKIWEISYLNPEMGLGLSVIDDQNNQVAANLAKAMGKVTVTITLHSDTGMPSGTDGWFYKIEFIPIDIDNVYILLRE